MALIGIDAHEVLDLGKKLEATPVRAGAKVAAAIRKTAHDIESDAKGLAPVDTGFLRNSIGMDLEGDGRFGTMSAEIGPTAEYGIYQEMGTSRMAAHPFMGPAYDRRIPAFEVALLQALEVNL